MLGFEVEWHEVPERDETDINEQALLSCGDASLLFSSTHETRPQWSGEIYLFVEDVDELHEELIDDVYVVSPPSCRAGLRTLKIRDCNGYVIVFAKVENSLADAPADHSDPSANAKFELFSALGKYFSACHDLLDGPNAAERW